MNTKKTRNTSVKKELKFKHEGRDYVVVIQCSAHRLDVAAERSKRGAGTILNSATLFDMTSFRESNK